MFATYRYLGGRCEFDKNNIFEMEMFDQYFLSKNIFAEYREHPIRHISEILMFGIINICTFGIAAPLVAGIYATTDRNEVNLTFEQRNEIRSFARGGR